MEINFVNPQFLYSLFYLGAGIFLYFGILFFAVKKNYPILQIFIMLSFISVVTIVGTKLITIPFNEWNDLILSADISHHTNRSAVGGLLFGLIALLFSYKVLKLPKSVLYDYAWLAPIGFGIQKLGCFFNGCCYGSLTDYPWGVSYPMHTAVHFHHFSSGIISSMHEMSLPVHPVQLYEVIGFALSGFIVWKFGRRLKKSGSALLLSIGLIFILRFFNEFLRDPASSQFNESIVFGIRTFEWFLLFFAMLSIFILVIYERFVKWDILENNSDVIQFDKIIFLLFTIALLTFTFRALFTKVEILTLLLRYIPAMVFISFLLIKRLIYSKIQLLNLGLVLLSILLMSQSLPKDTSKIKTKNRLDFEVSAGSLINEISYSPSVNSCGGISYDEDYYRNDYVVSGVGISSTDVYPKYSFKKGINLSYGANFQTNLTLGGTKQNYILAVNPYIKHDFKWIGYGLGFHLGNIWLDYDKTLEGGKSYGSTRYSIQPAFMLRLGVYKNFFFQTSYAYGLSSVFPSDFSEISFGSGLNSDTKRYVRIGLMLPNAAGYFRGEIQINNHFGLNTQWVIPLADKVGPYGQVIPRVSIGLRYDLN